MTFSRSAVLLALSGLLAGCGGAVQVEPPTPDAVAAATCTRLAGLLPARLSGETRGESAPESPYVTVWGDGAIALRCGVHRPARMAATDQLMELDGVGWFADPVTPTLFTAVTETAYVEVTVARNHQPTELLVDLAGPITSAQAG